MGWLRPKLRKNSKLCPGLVDHYNLMGTFVFAVSGALAAIDRHLDIFGVLVMAFVTACGGGVVRDLCIGATPP